MSIPMLCSRCYTHHGKYEPCAGEVPMPKDFPDRIPDEQVRLAFVQDFIDRRARRNRERIAQGKTPLHVHPGSTAQTRQGKDEEQVAEDSQPEGTLL